MSVPLDDRGLLLGDGLFETVLWTGARLVLFDAHFARLARGCAALGLPTPDLERVRSCAFLELENGGLRGVRSAVRFTWTAGGGGRGLDRPERVEPRLYVAAQAAPPPTGPARLVTASVRRNEFAPSSRLKTLAYVDQVAARREARAAGADEALMLNGRGEVACAAAANLFWFEGDRLVTPALECGVLDGIVRRAVLAQAAEMGLETALVRVQRESLERASGLFLTNSLIGVRPVSALDGVPVEPHRAEAALGERIARAFEG